MIRKYAFVTICISALAGCGQESSDSDVASPSDTFAESYAAAEAALAEAEANRNVWSKTDGILGQSRTAYDEGRTDDAIELANEARLQAELALVQAISQKKDWKANLVLE